MSGRVMITLDREVYNVLVQRAAGWGMSVDDYTSRDLRRILFEPATEHPFAFAAMIRLQREHYRSTMK
jgi:hypothetical protein